MLSRGQRKNQRFLARASVGIDSSFVLSAVYRPIDYWRHRSVGFNKKHLTHTEHFPDFNNSFRVVCNSLRWVVLKKNQTTMFGRS